MDLLAKRYASPFFLLDEYVRQGRLFEFVSEINIVHNDERLWELWLHKVSPEDNRSFDAWRNSLQKTADVEKVDESELKETVENSKNMLNGFVPE